MHGPFSSQTLHFSSEVNAERACGLAVLEGGDLGEERLPVAQKLRLPDAVHLEELIFGLWKAGAHVAQRGVGEDHVGCATPLARDLLAQRAQTLEKLAGPAVRRSACAPRAARANACPPPATVRPLFRAVRFMKRENSGAAAARKFGPNPTLGNFPSEMSRYLPATRSSITSFTCTADVWESVP